MSETSSELSYEHQPEVRQPFYQPRRVDTPDTVMTDLPLQPDISLKCPLCQAFVNLRELIEHRTFHQALELMEYRGQERPTATAELLTRRHRLVKKISRSTTPDRPLSVEKLQKLDAAYELLKARVENTYEELRQVKEYVSADCQGLSLSCSPPCVRAVGICSDGNERWKSTMEDTRVFQDYFGNDLNKSFFAIYDGHNGRFAAEVAANDLHHYLLNEMARFDPRTSCVCAVNMAEKNDLSDYDPNRPPPVLRENSLRHILHQESTNYVRQIIHTCEDNVDRLTNRDRDHEEGQRQKKSKRPKDPFCLKMQQALKTSYHQVDQSLSLGKDETSRVRWSGCSALTCVIRNTAMSFEEAMDDINGRVAATAADKENHQMTAAGTGQGQKKSVDPPTEKGYIHLANTGNIRAVLCRAGKAYRLSKDHSPSNPSERARVLKAGAKVSDSRHGAQVNGILDATRGLGNYGDPALKVAVTCDPYATSVVIDQYAQFLILATHGLWEVFSEDEAVSLLKQLLGQDLPPNQQHNPLLEQLYAEAEQVRLKSVQSFHSGDQHSTGHEPNRPLSHTSAPGNAVLESLVTADVGPFLDPLEEIGKELKSPAQAFQGEKILEDIQESPELEMDNTEEKEAGGDAIASTGKERNSKTPGEGEREVKESSAKVEGLKRRRSLATEKSRDIDMETEVGSQISLGEPDGFSDGDGNDADVETISELHSIRGGGLQMSEDLPPTRADIYCAMAKSMSERLVQAALLAGSKDNITVMVILLPGCKL